MSTLNKNNNYFQATSPTGQTIQGIKPIKKYFILDNLDKSNTLIANIPIDLRLSIKNSSDQTLELLIFSDDNQNINLSIKNKTFDDIKYTSITNQQYNNLQQDKNYHQQDKSYTTIKKDSQSPDILALNSMSANGGNSIGQTNLNFLIADKSSNIFLTWFTPLTKSNARGWISVEVIDDFMNLI